MQVAGTAGTIAGNVPASLSQPGSGGLGFLSPYRVLDLTDERGLLAGHLLAQLGADVLQIEPPTGSRARLVGPFVEGLPTGEDSCFWSAYAAGKRGITLALDRPEGRDLLLKLAVQADMVLESADPGVMTQAGLDYEAFRTANPRLIHVSITAFGSNGPKAGYAASDLAIWASAGPLYPHRTVDGTPMRISVPQVFHHAAADAVCGALIALLARGEHGRGQYVDVSAQESCALCTLSSHVADAVGHADYSPRGGVQSKRLLDHSGSGAKTRKTKWEVRDGLVEMHLGMGPAAGRYANTLFAWLRELGELPRDLQEWDWVVIPARIESGEVTLDDIDRARAIVGDVLARYTKDELMQIAQERGLLLAPVMSIGDLRRSPQLEARGYFIDSGGEEASRALPAPFATGCGTGAVTTLRRTPKLGEHNAEVYGQLLDFSPTALADLSRQGVI